MRLMREMGITSSSSALDASLTFMFEDSRIFLRVSVDIRCDIIDMLMDEIGASVYSRG